MLAIRWRDARLLLLDAHGRRVSFLLRAVRELDLAERVTVVGERAEVVGRTPAYRGGFALVTARGFGPPAAVAECGAPLLAPGGLLVVSEPPSSSPGEKPRWPVEGLAQLGLGAPRRAGAGYGFVTIPKASECPHRFPRRVGMPVKRPLF